VFPEVGTLLVLHFYFLDGALFFRDGEGVNLPWFIDQSAAYID
jgi:hypothetical protein